MKPKPTIQTPQKHLFQIELIDIVSPRHELVKLAKLIDWQRLEVEFKHSSTDTHDYLLTMVMAVST